MEEEKVRIPNQSGETYLMPVKVSYCKIDVSTPKARATLQKWVDTHDEYKKPHQITKLKGGYEVYISDLGKFKIGDWLYEQYGVLNIGIRSSSWKTFPRATVDELDSQCKGYYAYDENLKAANQVLARTKKDIKTRKEFEKKHGKGYY
jgi:hypothetical protein